MRSPAPALAALVLSAASLLACGPSAEERARAGGPDDAPAAWVELVLADREFADAAARDGTREAFLGFMAESAILFRPAPVAALPILQQGPGLGGELHWTPAAAYVSRDGATGLTSGPFRLRAGDGDRESYGRYVTLWRRRADGGFAVELTVRLPGPRDAEWPDRVIPLGPTYRWASEGMPDESGLVALDETFRNRYGAGDGDVVSAMAPHPDVLILRAGEQPDQGPEALRARANRVRRLGRLTWQAQGARFADDGSLGYVYGLAAAPAPTGSSLAGGAAAPFLHIWIRDDGGRWQLLVDLLGVPGA